jgi:hypothetical protein
MALAYYQIHASSVFFGKGTSSSPCLPASMLYERNIDNYATSHKNVLLDYSSTACVLGCRQEQYCVPTAACKECSKLHYMGLVDILFTVVTAGLWAIVACFTCCMTSANWSPVKFITYAAAEKHSITTNKSLLFYENCEGRLVYKYGNACLELLNPPGHVLSTQWPIMNCEV